MKNLILIISMLTFSFGLSAQTIVSGNITGVWNMEGSPYIIEDDVYVVDSLIIQSGVVVQFQAGQKQIEIGPGDKFLANGTKEYPITFEPLGQPGYGVWDKLYFVETDDNDTLNHCIIKNAEYGVYVYNCDPYINNCNFMDGVNGVIVKAYTSVSWAHVFATTIIDKCTFQNNLENGVVIYAGTSGYINNTAHAFAKIVNCTFYNNPTGIKAYGPSYPSGTLAEAIIINCIISYSNEFGINDSDITGSILAEDIIHTCFWENETGNFSGINLPPGFGFNGSYQNSNGDSCDVNYNIYCDPLFVDTTNANYNLQENSKCIDAGTNVVLGQIVYDPDGTMPDMGANYYDQGGVGINKIEVNNTSIYPNPFSLKTTINFPNPKHSNYKLSVFNISGNKVLEMENIKSDKIEFERGNLPEGVYLIELKGDKVFRGKMVVK